MNRNSSDKTAKIFLWLAGAVIFYVQFSLVAFWIRNPQLTQMELYSHFIDALFWK